MRDDFPSGTTISSPNWAKERLAEAWEGAALGEQEAVEYALASID